MLGLLFRYTLRFDLLVSDHRKRSVAWVEFTYDANRHLFGPSYPPGKADRAKAVATTNVGQKIGFMLITSAFKISAKVHVPMLDAKAAAESGVQPQNASGKFADRSSTCHNPSATVRG
jgi:hypothetical protein